MVTYFNCRIKKNKAVYEEDSPGTSFNGSEKSSSIITMKLLLSIPAARVTFPSTNKRYMKTSSSVLI